MERNEKLILIRDVPAAIVDALDGVMATQGLVRVGLREIEEDWTPLLLEEGGPIVFILSQPQMDWSACFSSLSPEHEWQLSEALAVALEQPTIYAILSDATSSYAYRYFEDGVLHADIEPGASAEAPIDGEALIRRIEQHGVPRDLIDDRILSFGTPHILLGYDHEREPERPISHDQSSPAVAE